MSKQKKDVPTTPRTSLERVVDGLISELYAPAAVVVDAAFDVRLFRGRTALFLEHAPGRPSLQLLSMLRPGLFAPVENLLHAVMRNGEAFTEPIILEENNRQALLFVARTFTHTDTALRERFFLITCLRIPVQLPRATHDTTGSESVLALEIERMRQYVGVASHSIQSTEKEREKLVENLEEVRAELNQLKSRLAVREKRAVQLEATLESIGEGVLVADAHAVVEYANPRACVLLQGTREEVCGKLCTKVVQLVDRSGQPLSNEHPLQAAVARGTDIEYGEEEAVYLSCFSGQRIPVRLHATPICEGDTCIGAVLVFHDLSESLRLHQAREEFISYASHQLRTPLSVISLNVELLQRLFGSKEHKSDDATRSLSTVSRASKRMIDLMNTLLSLARLDAGTLLPSYHTCNVRDLCKEVKEQLQPLAAEQQIALEVRAVASCVVNTDPQFLHMILQNLLSNAIKYGRRHTRTTCHATLQKGILVLKVSDKGIGIPKKDLAHIFERHYRAPGAIKSRQEGSGLGLYLVKSMVTLLGGSIEVQSKRGTGTTFYVRLPAENTS